MKVHNYVYNYGFLADWMRANPSIKRNELLQSMEMCDYGTLAKWVDGVTMMPLAQMMKFCNKWSVPITAFFMDEKAEKGDNVAPITPDACIEPAGGWPDSSRKAGIKICDPRTTIHMTSNLPSYIHVENTENTQQPTTKEGNKKSTSDISTEERMKYLDIIEKQNDRILDLTEENKMLFKKVMQNSMDNPYSYDMAAEPSPDK